MTAAIAERLGAIVVKHPINKGKGEALRISFKKIMELNLPLKIPRRLSGLLAERALDNIFI